MLGCKFMRGDSGSDSDAMRARTTEPWVTINAPETIASAPNYSRNCAVTSPQPRLSSPRLSPRLTDGPSNDMLPSQQLAPRHVPPFATEIAQHQRLLLRQTSLWEGTERQEGCTHTHEQFASRITIIHHPLRDTILWGQLCNFDILLQDQGNGGKSSLCTAVRRCTPSRRRRLESLFFMTLA